VLCVGSGGTFPFARDLKTGSPRRSGSLVLLLRSLNLGAENLWFAGGRIFGASNPEDSLSFARVAAASHWYPDSLSAAEPSALLETVCWSPSALKAPNVADEINTRVSMEMEI
jgi:2-furoyl-CoA dehydrogenase large subunit